MSGTLPVLSRALFAGLIGDQFTVSTGPDGGGETLTLVEVEVLGRMDPDHEAFSLIFHGDPSTTLPHDTMPVQHPAIGNQAIFLGPIARDDMKTVYQAIFN